MGLIHPYDYDAWARWERSQHRLRNLKHAVVNRVRPAPDEPLVLTSETSDPSVLVALDVARGTSVDALLAPLGHLKGAAILSRGALPEQIVPEGWRSKPLETVDHLPASIRVVLSAGSFPHVSLPAHRWADAHGARFVVVQHGLLTPFAPPLPEDCHLLAWSAADAAFWTSGRSDVSTDVVGSHLLWKAAQRPSAEVAGEPVFLGQLHGTELLRTQLIRVSGGFCRRTGATYRPHPGERDIASRLVHRYWASRGIAIDPGRTPLDLLTKPVVSIFSTGILEAAAQRRSAWGYHPDPPPWIREFWSRYSIGEWGGAPTPNPVGDSLAEPGAAIASWVAGR